MIVHNDFRKREFAINLLNQFKQNDDNIYDLMNFHFVVCLAIAKTFENKKHITLQYCDFNFDNYILINDINVVIVDFIRDNANVIIKISSIEYVKNVELRDNFFDFQNINEIISFVYIKFFVDHIESLDVLK